MVLQKNVYLCSLVPCRKALVQHVVRVNFQMAIWRHADTHVIQIPNATDGHCWTLDDDGDGEM